MTVALLNSFIGLAIVLIIVYTIRYYYNRSLIEVKSVKAGPTQCHCGSCVENYHIGPFDTFYHNGKRVDPRKYIVARVDGDCMSTRGVFPGNIIFIQPITDENKKNLKNGDILYIKYERDGFTGYKIREFKSVHGEDAVNTIYYTAENKPKDSHDPHKLTNIEGVVKYNFKS
ncbi:MAG: hypothetical protein J6I54_04505 [Bacteroidaceae bacterium]|nr:hypothetical protein [Bacteroidaceae bacterium]